MRGRLSEITEGIGGGVEGLPAGEQPVVERTELPGAQWAREQTRDYNFKADPMLQPFFISQSKLWVLQNLWQLGSWPLTGGALPAQIWKCFTNVNIN